MVEVREGGYYRTQQQIDYGSGPMGPMIAKDGGLFASGPAGAAVWDSTGHSHVGGYVDLVEECEPVRYQPKVVQLAIAHPVFTHERWEQLLADTVQEIQNLSKKKGGEYAGDTDRLANFRRNGERLGLPMETVWAVYAGKHWDAISQYIMDKRNGKERERLEPIEGRVDDLLVYLLLLKAMLLEARDA